MSEKRCRQQTSRRAQNKESSEFLNWGLDWQQLCSFDLAFEAKIRMGQVVLVVNRQEGEVVKWIGVEVRTIGVQCSYPQVSLFDIDIQLFYCFIAHIV